MRARIVFAWDAPGARILQSHIQQVLTDVAVAFGHSFVMKAERMGEASTQAWGSAMTEETIDACRQADAAIALLSRDDGLLELAQGLGAVLACHVYDLWPKGAVDSALKSGLLPAGIICYPLFADERLTDAAQIAYQLTGTLRTRMREIPFDGSLRKAWLLATGALAARYTTTLPIQTTLNEALAEMVSLPDQLGAVFAKPGAAQSLCAVADALCGSQAPGHVRYMGGKPLHAFVTGAQAERVPAPLGALGASADLLRTALHLSREADCLLAAAANVSETAIASDGGQAADAWERISQQIALVGELLHPKG